MASNALLIISETITVLLAGFASLKPATMLVTTGKSAVVQL
jgi:hypothetical protein